MDYVGRMLRCAEVQKRMMDLVKEVSRKYFLKNVSLDVVEEELQKKIVERGIPLDLTYVTDEDVENFLKFFNLYLKVNGFAKLHELRILHVVRPCIERWYLGVADTEYALWLYGDFFDRVRTPLVFYISGMLVDYVTLNNKSLTEGAKIVKKFFTLPEG